MQDKQAAFINNQLHCLICNFTLPDSSLSSESSQQHLFSLLCGLSFNNKAKEKLKFNVKRLAYHNLMFVISKLLEIPPKRLTDKRFSSTPTANEDCLPPLVLCELCHDVLEEAAVIYKQLLELAQKFKTVQRNYLKILLKISWENPEQENKNFETGGDVINSAWIGNECRELIGSKGNNFNSGASVFVEEIGLSDWCCLEENVVKEEYSDCEVDDYDGDGTEDAVASQVGADEDQSDSKDTWTMDAKPVKMEDEILCDEAEVEDSSGKEEEDNQSIDTESSDWEPPAIRKSPSKRRASRRSQKKTKQVSKEVIPKRRQRVSLVYEQNSEGRFMCPEEGCSRTYLKNSHVSQHIRRRHLTMKKETTTAKDDNRKNWEMPANSLGKYECPEEKCAEVYSNKWGLYLHIRKCHLESFPKPSKPVYTANSDGKFECDEKGCGKAFRQKYALVAHIRTRHLGLVGATTKAERISCEVEGCSKMFSNRQTYSSHLDQHRGTPRVKCKDCGEMFFTNAQRRTHMERFHKIFAMPTMSEAFGTEFKRDPQSGQFMCLEVDCGRRFSNKAALVKHVRSIHRGEKLFQCEVAGCGKSYTSVVAFRGHIDRHKGTPRYKCEECGERFYEWNPLKRHQESVHMGGKVNKMFVCELCGMGHTSTHYLQVHRSVHHRDKTDGSTKRHEAGGVGSSDGATGEKVGSWPCETCGKSFKSLLNLQQHVKYQHEEGKDVKRWCCHLCPKRYRGNNQLQVHLYSAHRAAPQPKKYNSKRYLMFQCKVVGCRKKFSTEKSLNEHTSKWHGEDGAKVAPFQCKFCGKAFFQKCKLVFHEQVHQNKHSNPFKCEICHKGFPTDHHLRCHKRGTHKMDLDNKRFKTSSWVDSPH